MKQYSNRILLVGTQRTCSQASKLSFNSGEFLIPFPLLETKLLDDLKFPKDLYDWLIFTSPASVQHYFSLSKKPRSTKIAVVGPATKSMVENFGFKIDFIPSHYNSECLADEFLKIFKTKTSVLFPASILADNTFTEVFENSQIELTRVNIYAPGIVEQEILPEFNGVVFFSSSAVKAFFENYGKDILKDKKIAAIGEKAAVKFSELYGFMPPFPENSTAAETIKLIL